MHWKINALWGGRKVELCETQRAVTPFWGAGGVHRVSAAGRISPSGEQVSAVSSYFPQRHRSGGDLHGLLGLGGGRSTAVCPHEFAACGCGLARVAGDLALSGRRHHSQPVQALWPGTVPAFFLGLVELADRAATGMFGWLQFGSGLDGVRALRAAGRRVARAESAQAWAALASSAAGGVGRSAFSAARLVAERQLRHGPRRSGISQGGPGAVTGKTCASRDPRRRGLF